MKLSLVVGEKKTVTIGGGRFYYESGLGRIRVKTISSAPGEFDLSPGMGFQNRADMDNFFAVEIENISGFDQTIEFIISYREVFDNRVVFGEGIDVKPVDVDRLRTEARRAFWLQRYGGSPAAGAYANLSLRNPLGSGRNVFVRKVIVGAAVPLDILLMSTYSMEADEANAAVSTLDTGSPSSSKYPLNGGSNTSVSRVGQFRSTGGAFGGLRVFGRAFSAANTMFAFEFAEPVKLGQGAGLVVGTWTANTSIAANFELYEEDI